MRGYSMAKTLVLTAVTGLQIGKKHMLGSRTGVIGSASNCDLVLIDRTIEPRHAEVRHMLDSWFIVPLTASGTGISVNGTIIKAQSRVRPGDKVTLGSTTYLVAVEELSEREYGR
jgi:predicted component of type VI protein secretion system